MPMCVCTQTSTLNSNITCHIRCGITGNYFVIFTHTFAWYVLPLPIYSNHRHSSPLLLQILPRQHHDWGPKSSISYRYMQACLQIGKAIYSWPLCYTPFFSNEHLLQTIVKRELWLDQITWTLEFLQLLSAEFSQWMPPPHQKLLLAIFFHGRKNFLLAVCRLQINIICLDSSYDT